MEATKHQEKTIENQYKGGTWVYPCCKAKVLYSETIENPGENKTQILCKYGCGYIFIEDFT